MFSSTVDSISGLLSEYKDSHALIQLIAFLLITTAAIVGISCAIIWELTIAILGGIFYALVKG